MGYSGRRCVLVAIIGVDGSGKSALAGGLHEELSRGSANVRTLWGGFKDWSLLKPFFNTIRRRRNSGELENLTTRERYVKSRAAFRGNVARFFYFVLVSLDYTLQMIIEVVLRKEDIVILDRYYYDQAASFSVELDSPRAMKWFLFFFSKVLPAPDIVFVVFVSPETALCRKSDIPSAEFISARLEVYNQLANVNRFTRIDGNLQLGDNVKKMVNEMSARGILRR
jgi:thymidylate kinase